MESAITTSAGRLAPDGLLYGVVPPCWRARALHLLTQRGLVVEGTYLHFRQASSTHYVLPIDAAIARRLCKTLPAKRLKLLSALLLSVLPGAPAVASRCASKVGWLLRRPAARRSFEWISPGPARLDASRVVIRYKPMGDRVNAVLSAFSSPGAELSDIVKVPLTATASVDRRREAETLTTCRPAASQAGARVPTVDVIETRDGRSALRFGVVAGEPAGIVLTLRPDRLSSIVREIARWLGRWNALTGRAASADKPRLQRHLLQPARLLARDLDGGSAYLEWLEQQCALVRDAPLPYVAAHNDLTMSNVLVLKGDPTLGVLDWETARDDGLPLTDLFYAIADARAVSRGDRDRTRSLIEAFDSESVFGRWVDRLADDCAGSVGISGRLTRLLKHACALEHAIDERSRAERGSGPFLALVQSLAQRNAAQLRP
ncbi:MAG: hypothetical protein A3H29_00795 [Acidobacteria bacterium RIFCSPLOWO2_02_FULL_67_21]|nr:MAG: hypothetical protein A3H29_00795 [Acidobacteria bacterium RIFCSPLOWO2_02_FULL_67_21]